ncbi:MULTISPECIES: recombinase family protein [unclassified Aureimonas]|uniref:recombinase family protein n=1 Tax=unclassified Aureimonas TaxID=2615206 RepID=UPI0006F69E31|nr:MULTISPECIES: recombinase family protein [unclassified Aureimonas]KQT52993.1 DNA invertase [Aureimonas sp. Leaf427]KQT80450.1 DNA invertase [Aureimonas sp. Leaf460]
MTTQLIGYGRTSTVDQKSGLEAQRATLEGVGCHKLFLEQISSVAIHRPALEAALSYVREGDVLIATKIDRLARSMSDLLMICRRLDEKGVSLRVLAMDLDTSTATGKLMLHVLGSVAEFERTMMRERQLDGVQRAKAAGVYKGRVPTAMRKTDEVIQLKARGMTANEIAQAVGISRASTFRILASLKDRSPADRQIEG